MFAKGRRVGEDTNAAGQPSGKAAKFAAHALDLLNDDTSMIDEALPCRSQFDAATIALQKINSEHLFHPPDTSACGRQSQVRTLGAMRDASRLGDVKEELQVDQVKAHPWASCAFVMHEGYLRKLHIAI